MVSNEKRIEDNLAAVHQRIEEAAVRSGRSAQDITLVAVTKYVDAGLTRMVAQAGCHTLGESRPQQLWMKAEALADDSDIRWHMIGHMQRNKLARTLPSVSVFHSIDSLRLLTAMQNQAEKTETKVDALIEVNISAESNKTGFPRNDVSDVLHQLGEFPLIRITGLMAMASRLGGPDRARRDFSELREFRDQLVSQVGSCDLQQLSMGMSNDFEIAIEEGATIVRVGSALFEGIER